MSIIVKPNIFVPGTVIRSAEVNDDFDTIYNDYNGNIRDVNIHLSSAKILVGNASNQAVERTMTGDGTLSNTGVFTLTGSSVSAIIAASQYIPPIGTIQPFYDFGGLLTFNAASWAYCNGQAIAVGSIGVQTLPDLSNRYLVGFGTEGGGDIGTAPFLTAAVGNASHQTNLQHSHTVNAHTHDLANHTHNGGAHTHAAGTLYARIIVNPQVGTFPGSDNSFMQKVDVAAWDSTNPYQSDGGSLGSPGTGFTEATAVGGDTASGGSGATSGPSTNTSGSASPGTDMQLSTTQSIQPRSIRVRFLMRIS